MNTKYIIAIFATVLVMCFLFFKDKKESIQQAEENEIEDASAAEAKIAAKTAYQAVTVAKPAVGIGASVAPVVAAPEVPQVSDKVMQQFSVHLKMMTKCLDFPAEQGINDKTVPSLENLQAILRATLGEVVVQMDDWTQTEFVDLGGVRKRVRVDYDYPEGAIPVRRLSMYQVNSYNMPEIISLSADEANNPNVAYIASLTEGQNLTYTENGARAYFTEGEELVLASKNGLLQSFSINKADRAFNCFNLADEGSTCNCQ